MNQSRVDILVGIFVLAGMISLGYLAIGLGKLQIVGASGYFVYGDFASVAGLKIGDSVEIAGVKIGRVESIGLADGRARLGFRIDLGIELQDDVIASVRSRGLIGDKYVLLTLGASDRHIKDGGQIRDTESPPDLTEVLGKFIGGDLSSGGK
ncbi:MAG: outer membrane lipid asymmetry maintenance protein MlaD [Candidatus Binatia bacterium]